MNEELLAVSLVSEHVSSAGQVTISKNVGVHLGDAGRVAWFLDRDTGRVHIIDVEEVEYP